MKKKLIIKIFAFLALFGILVWILWTWVLFFMSKKINVVEDKPQISEKELNMLIDSIKKTDSWQTQTWEINNEDILNMTESGVLISSWELNNK